MSKVELLMPAGSLLKLKTAILYGADAVYLGTPDMSLRTKSTISLEEVLEGIKFAHKHGKKVYLTLNMFAHNKDIAKLDEYISTISSVRPDGLIISDLGVFQYVKNTIPDMEIHISTQANTCSWLAVDFWQNQGAKLCVMSREVSFAELKQIREKCPNIKLEAFIHGSMCMTYSGRCMLSNYLIERGANQGNCANSCRWKYKVHMKLKDGTLKELQLTEENLELFDFFLEEENRSGELMEILEDQRGSYILNAKDLCLMPKLDQYLALNLDSFKVEGRGRSAYYVAVTARAYRMAIDDWYQNADDWDYKKYFQELETIPNRGYSLAFHEGRLTNLAHNYETTRAIADFEFAGFISAVLDDHFIVEVKNKIEAGDVLEFVSPFSRKVIMLRIYEFFNIRTQKVTDVINAGQKPLIKIMFSWFDQENITDLTTWLPELTVIRKRTALTSIEWNRLRLDKIAMKLEAEHGNSDNQYKVQLQKLQDSVSNKANTEKVKTPKLGIEGCCGKGCNGCLIFWYDDAYDKARDILSRKKQGEMLEYNMINKTMLHK